MKVLKQVLIIIVISLLGELLKYLLLLPFPSSIYGLIILFLALEFKIVKLESIKTISEFLITIMPIMFVPPSVGLMESYGLLKRLCIPVILVGIVSTFLIMVSTGSMAQLVIKKGGKKHD